jgi:hypothetical protein
LASRLIIALFIPMISKLLASFTLWIRISIPECETWPYLISNLTWGQ